MEREAAFAIFNKSTLVKAIVHFDTTGRNSIDGEWPSLILKFSDGIEYRLWPIFFAFENREQITNLFVEVFGILTTTLKVSHDQTLQPKTLWEKVDAIMTVLLQKKLEKEKTIAKALDSSHIPLHLLCKSRPVEALDKSSLEVLNEIEKSAKHQEIFGKINPALKLFFRGKKALVKAEIEALLSLITHDKSAKSCSQVDLFDFPSEREGVSKRVFLYQQKRFAKLGKAALSILEAKDVLQMLVDEVEGTNQLVESCKIYLSSELFITELQCLAYFNHFVIFPFLNCVEMSTQDDFLFNLPKLHEDLKAKESGYIEQIHCFNSWHVHTNTFQ